MPREHIFLSGGAFMGKLHVCWASKYQKGFKDRSGGTYILSHEIRKNGLWQSRANV